jgi:hypothetical protein
MSSQLIEGTGADAPDADQPQYSTHSDLRPSSSC